MEEREDAYGRLILDAVADKQPIEVVERDDRLVLAYDGRYLRLRRRAGLPASPGARSGRGRYRQSPGAIEACRSRGVRDARLAAIDEVDERLGRFDTLLLLGNNFGLLGGEKAARRALRRLHAITNPGGRLIGQSFDPHGFTDRTLLDYAERNVARGRPFGLQRIRVRYLDRATPWFDATLYSPEEMAALLEGTGWRLRRTLPGRGPGYVAIIDRV